MSIGFRHQLRAEWTKFRSVRANGWAALAAVLLTAVAGALMGAAQVTMGSPLGSARYVHQPLTGDGSVVARVLSHDSPPAGPRDPQAKSGLMLRAEAGRAEPYAALMVTPGLGVRLQAGFRTDLAAGPATLPQWLKLTRSGDTVTGFRSADGAAWTEVGRVTLAGLPRTVRIGLFSAAPFVTGNAGDGTAAAPAARFDRVRLTPAPAQPWTHVDVGSPEVPGSSSELDGTFLVAGSGDLWYPPFDLDRVRLTLFGIVAGGLLVATVGVRFATTEYARRLIHTTFSAGPRRGRVLAAKVLVVAAAGLLVGLAGAATAYLVTRLRDADSFVPASGLPALPPLTDPTAMRAVAGTGLFLALFAVLSLAAGLLLRRTAGALAAVLGLVLLPQVVALAQPPGSMDALLRVLPAAGLAIQQSAPTNFDHPVAIGPWAGLGVLCAWTAAALLAAYVLLRRRDA